MTLNIGHWGFPVSEHDEPPDGPVDITAVLNYLNSNVYGRVPMVARGTLGDRPAAGKADRRWLVQGDATPANNDIEWIDTGAGWVATGLPQAGDGISVTGRTVSVRRNANAGLGITGGELYIVTDDATVERNANTLRIKDGGVTGPKIANALKPSAGAGDGTEALRRLGTAAGQAAPGVSLAAEAWHSVSGEALFGFEPVESISWTNDIPARPAMYMRHMGTTYVRGHAGYAGSSEPTPGVFRLPVGYRPPATMEFNNESVSIDTDGWLNTGHNPDTILLDGISFRHA